MPDMSWDTTGPLHAAKCDRVEGLLDAAGPGSHLLAGPVADELIRLQAPEAAAFFIVEPLESMEALQAFARWMAIMGSSPEDGHDVGEAGAAAVAELNEAVLIIDDRKSTKVARNYGLEAHGTLWAISRTVVDGTRPGPGAHSGLCDAMLGTGIRWNMEPGGYPRWYEEHRLDLQ